MSSGGSSERLRVYGETAFEHLMLNSTIVSQKTPPESTARNGGVFFYKNFFKIFSKFA